MSYLRTEMNGWPRVMVASCKLGLLACSLTASVVVAQGQADALTAHGPEVLSAESLGADDLLEVTVAYCPELSHTFRVSADGTLSLPLLKQRLKAAGKTPVELSHELQTALEGEQVLVAPVVNISVLEYRSRPVSVVGAVNHPLTFQATGQTTLIDALAKAGGLDQSSGGSIYITSRPKGDGGVETRDVKVIPAKELLRGDNAALNVQMHGGEEIRVPEASKIFVAGNVRRPGMYAMQGDSETTVLKAITLSQGLDAYSGSSAFIYRRKGATEDRDELKVPLNRILTHKSPDMELLADDILYIPTSGGKRLTSRVLSQLAGFGQTAGTGLLIYK